MKATITQASRWDFKKIMEIKSLDYLFELAKEFNCNSFVVSISSLNDDDIEIEIYDDWRE